MGLNDKIKGSYYRNYEARLASRNTILTTIDDLKKYYTNLVEMISTTYDKITNNRTEMKEKLNSILLKIKTIEYTINNFQLEVDSSIAEKLNKLLENYDQDFVSLVNSYDTNLYNHSNLEDTYSTNDTLYTQPVVEYEKSIEKLNSNVGIRWFGGKISDKSLLNKLKSLIHIVKVNNYEGIENEDYINSNLILDIFFYSSKGITWLTLGKDNNFGYNIKVRYNSLKNKSFNLKLESENYYNVKSYELNEFDLNMLLDFGYTDNDITNGNIYIKIKTNIPSNSYSGMEEYYISSADSINQNNDKRIIRNISQRHIGSNNKDYAYNTEQITDLTSFRTRNKKFDSKTDYNPDFIDNNYDKTDTFNDDNFTIYTEIKPTNGTDADANEIISSVKRNTDNKEITGRVSNVGSIVVKNEDNEKTKYNLDYFGNENDFRNGEDSNQTILYNENKQRINLRDYRNVGDVGLITKNEQTFVIDSSLNKNKDVTVVDNNESLKNDKIPSISNDITNNILLDLNSDNSFKENMIQINKPDIINNNLFNNEYDNDLKDSLITKKINISSTKELFLRNSKLYVIENLYIKQIDDQNYYEVYDFVRLNNGIIFIFTNKGIKEISKENIDNGTYTVENTNIINGRFTTACLTNEGNSFYTINSQDPTISAIDETTGKYKLTGFFYVYDPNTMEIKDVLDYCTTYNLSSDIIASEDKSFLQELINVNIDNSEDSTYKLIYWNKSNSWFILNKATGKVYNSKDSTFGNFSINKEIEKVYNNVELFSLDSYTNDLYICKNKNYLEPFNGITEEDLVEDDQEALKAECLEKINALQTDGTTYDNIAKYIDTVKNVNTNVDIWTNTFWDDDRSRICKINDTYYIAYSLILYNSDNDMGDTYKLPIYIYSTTDFQELTLVYTSFDLKFEVFDSYTIGRTVTHFKYIKDKRTIFLGTFLDNDGDDSKDITTYCLFDLSDSETNTSIELFNRPYSESSSLDIKPSIINKLNYSISDSTYSLIPMKKATKTIENSISKYERTITLKNISDIYNTTRSNIEDECNEDLIYCGYEPIRIDGTLYILTDNFPSIVETNGYYYILGVIDENNYKIYKVDYNRVVKNEIINGDSFHIGLLYGFNNYLFINNNYTDKESVKNHPEVITEDKRNIFNIISVNKK